MRVHATPQDLAADPWGVTVDNADALLRAASALIDVATTTAIYAVDTDGVPRDRRVADALRDATCAQAATWAALGIDPVKGPAGDDGPRIIARKSLGSGTVEYEPSGAATARAEAATSLHWEAAHLLRMAGLLQPGVVAYG